MTLLDKALTRMAPEEVEERTFRNAVEYERTNLLRIINGELATNVYTSHRRMYLLRHGILHRKRHGVSARPSVPTQRAIKILEEQER